MEDIYIGSYNYKLLDPEAVALVQLLSVIYI